MARRDTQFPVPPQAALRRDERYGGILDRQDTPVPKLHIPQPLDVRLDHDVGIQHDGLAALFRHEEWHEHPGIGIPLASAS
jgi:hypothetical protein